MTASTVPHAPKIWRIGKIAFTLLLLAMLWSALDGPAVLQRLASAHMGWLAAAVLVLMLQTILSAWRWSITAAQLGQTLQLRSAIGEYFISQSVNQAAPGAVMGDAARAVRARGEVGLATAGLAVALERFAGQIAMFLTLACALLVTSMRPGGLDLAPDYGVPVMALLGAILLAGLVIFGLSTKSDGRFRKWTNLAYRGLLAPQVLPTQIVLGLSITACNLAAFGLSAMAVGVDLSFSVLVTLVPLVLFSMLIPLTVSGWGVREGSAAILLPLAGISAPEAVAVSVLFGVALLIAVLPGFVLMVTK